MTHTFIFIVLIFLSTVVHLNTVLIDIIAFKLELSSLKMSKISKKIAY